MVADLLQLARPRDWIKQAFVLMPVPFALASDAELEPVSFALGVLAFCLASSAVYAYDDALDAALDRQHPVKRKRPVADGRIGAGQARGLAALLLAAALLLGVASGSGTAVALIAAYALLNLLYGHFAKHVPLVDVFLLSTGFVIRVFLGCALMRVEPSNWLLLCSSTLALFLALTKRRADLVSGVDASHRPSLSGYTTAFLEQATGITAGVALLSYALYSLDAGVFLPGREFASLPFVAFGILDYLRLAHTRNLGGSPVDVVTSEPSVPICAIGWAITAAWSLGLTL
jgi:4-hydroxybenzoate polyprenyltransferase